MQRWRVRRPAIAGVCLCRAASAAQRADEPARQAADEAEEAAVGRARGRGLRRGEVEVRILAAGFEDVLGGGWMAGSGHGSSCTYFHIMESNYCYTENDRGWPAARQEVPPVARFPKMNRTPTLDSAHVSAVTLTSK